jgi:hypothetical protein
MTYVVTENCIKCKYIDCDVCELECPAESTCLDVELRVAPERLELNRTYSRFLSDIVLKSRPPADAQARVGAEAHFRPNKHAP